MKSKTLAAALLLLLVPRLVRAQPAPPASTGPATVAQDVNPTGWTSKVGLSYVQTGGNSEASTFGLKFGVAYNWTKTYFNLVGSSVRSNSTSKDTNSRLALQVSLLAYYDNLPALQSVPVYGTAPPVGLPRGDVLVPYGKWDTEFSVSLVVNIAPKKPAPAPAGGQ